MFRYFADVGLVCISYAGNMITTFCGRRGSFESREDVRRLVHYFEEEFHALYKALD
jgi:hypothetical protein